MASNGYMDDREGEEDAWEDRLRQLKRELDRAEDPFIRNVIEGNIGRVRKLLEAGADVNSVNQFSGTSKLRRAVDKTTGRSCTIPNHRVHRVHHVPGNTALLIAIANCHLEMVHELLMSCTDGK